MTSVFRIQRVRPAADILAEEEASYEPPTYAEKLVKLIPTEVVALYLVGQSAINQHFGSGSPADDFFTAPWAWSSWSLICLAGVFALRAYLTRDRERNIEAEWPAVAISALAFVIWVYAFGDVFKNMPMGIGDIHSPLLGTLLLAAGNFFLPLLYNPDPI